MTDQESAQRTLKHADALLYFRGRHEQGEDFETFRTARMLLWQAMNRVLTGDDPETFEPYDLTSDLAALEVLAVALEKAPKRIRRASIQWLLDKYLPGEFVRKD